MEVLVTGASGFIGSALLAALVGVGHRPVVAVRGRDVPAGVDGIRWDPAAGTIDAAALEGIGAVVHLAGAGIGDRRWTDERKRLLVESRVPATELLARTLAALTRPPGVLVSGSAVGYYGDRGADVLTEASSAGEDFAARLCRDWEAATEPAVAGGIRVVIVRSGIVLGKGGGMLGRVLTPFRAGLGGRLGSGRQYLSWITLADEVRALLHALDRAEFHGAVNLTAPNPVTNAEFTTSLGRALHRPTFLPTPTAPLKAVYGAELVETLLLAGQRVLPAALEASGFDFEEPALETALGRIVRR